MKIGLLGGTFDPPHFGHLIMGEEARRAAELDEVWFLPTYLPPHKDRHVTDAQHRIEMLQRATFSNPYFRVNLIEQERMGQSYTLDTVRILKSQYPEHSFFFILGGDMVEDLPNWHRFDELKKMITFIGINRTGYRLDHTSGLNLIEVRIPTIDLSSTIIRERIGEGQTCRYFMPENVRLYIEENGLYEQSEDTRKS